MRLLIAFATLLTAAGAAAMPTTIGNGLGKKDVPLALMLVRDEAIRRLAAASDADILGAPVLDDQARALLLAERGRLIRELARQEMPNAEQVASPCVAAAFLATGMVYYTEPCLAEVDSWEAVWEYLLEVSARRIYPEKVDAVATGRVVAEYLLTLGPAQP